MITKKQRRIMLLFAFIALVAMVGSCTSLSSAGYYQTQAPCTQKKMKKTTKHASAKKYKSKVATGKW